MIQNNQLITKAELKDYLNWKPQDEELDEFFDSIINSASDIIEQYCNTKLKKCEITETVSGTGTDRLYLSNRNIISVTVIKYWDGTDFVNYYSSGEIQSYLIATGHVLYNRADIFEEGTLNFQLSYICGYDPVPNDIKLVCLELCAVLFKNSSSGESRVGLLSNQQGSFKAFVLDELPRHKNIINKYRLINI